jgi:gliding motility-associated-like protein
VETNSNIEIKGSVEICPKSDVKAKEDSKVSENKVHIQNENIKPTVQTNSVLIPKESSIQFTLPNVFTPNGDGTNDYLETKIEGVNEFSVVVLNDNGKVVYQSQDTEFKWDGTFQTQQINNQVLIIFQKKKKFLLNVRLFPCVELCNIHLKNRVQKIK